jgi:hypothetical protein
MLFFLFDNQYIHHCICDTHQVCYDLMCIKLHEYIIYMQSKNLDLMILPLYIFSNILTIKNSLDDLCLVACKLSSD